MPHHVIVGQENNSCGDRQNNQHPVKRVLANRRKLHYIEGIIMLDREFPLHVAQEVHSKYSGTELGLWKLHRTPDYDLANTLNTE